MKTLQEKYNAIQENRFTKAQFLRDARMTFPGLITQFNGYEDTVRILRNKGIVTEVKDESPSYEPPVPVAEEDYYSIESVERGIRAELAAMGINPIMGVTLEEYEKAKALVLKNLKKDPNFYLHELSGEEHKEGGRPDGLTDVKDNADNQMVKAQLKEAVKKLIVKALNES